jgi:hypothetical protein
MKFAEPEDKCKQLKRTVDSGERRKEKWTRKTGTAN